MTAFSKYRNVEKCESKDTVAYREILTRKGEKEGGKQREAGGSRAGMYREGM